METYENMDAGFVVCFIQRLSGVLRFVEVILPLGLAGHTQHTPTSGKQIDIRLAAGK